MEGKECFSSTWHRQVGSNKIVCNLCPHECELEPGYAGICRVRANRDDKLVLNNYGHVTGPSVDRIQKRPVYLYPGYSKEDKTPNSISIGSTGCNNRCPFCQNFEISQVGGVGEWFREASPEEIMKWVEEENCSFVSFSFNEPIIIYEYFCDVADYVRERGIKVCVKTAGYISELHWDDFLSRVDAINIDIKPMDKDYEKSCGVFKREVVLDFLRASVKKGVHTEVSHILIEGGESATGELCEGVNDNEKCMDLFFDAIHGIDPEMGVHLLRHYPAWKSNYPVTSDASLEKWGDYLREKGLKNVFTDDVG